MRRHDAIEDLLQVGANGQRQRRRHVGSARVSDGTLSRPAARCSADQAHRLVADLMPVACSQCNTEHRNVYTHVGDGERLRSACASSSRRQTMATVLDPRLDTLDRVGTAMADGVRRQILVRLVDGPAYPAELADAMGESRANVSNHLACLRGCGLVRATREGRQMRYDLADRRLARALKLLADITLVVEPGHSDLDGRP